MITVQTSSMFRSMSKRIICNTAMYYLSYAKYQVCRMRMASPCFPPRCVCWVFRGAQRSPWRFTGTCVIYERGQRVSGNYARLSNMRGTLWYHQLKCWLPQPDWYRIERALRLLPNIVHEPAMFQTVSQFHPSKLKPLNLYFRHFIPFPILHLSSPHSVTIYLLPRLSYTKWRCWGWCHLHGYPYSPTTDAPIISALLINLAEKNVYETPFAIVIRLIFIFLEETL